MFFPRPVGVGPISAADTPAHHSATGTPGGTIPPAAPRAAGGGTDCDRDPRSPARPALSITSREPSGEASHARERNGSIGMVRSSICRGVKTQRPRLRHIGRGVPPIATGFSKLPAASNPSATPPAIAPLRTMRSIRWRAPPADKRSALLQEGQVGPQFRRGSITRRAIAFATPDYEFVEFHPARPGRVIRSATLAGPETAFGPGRC